jgi:hypothetical protein
MKKIFLSTFLSQTLFLKADAAVSYAKASSSILPTGFIVFIVVLSVLLTVGIIWIILRPIRRRKQVANVHAPKPPLRHRVIRPLTRPRRRVIIVR